MLKEEFLRMITERGFHLSTEQWQAVSCENPAQAVFAGPGSGKTTVITLRTAYLHLVKGVSPDQIIVFTFTRKSAAELRQRLLFIDPVFYRVQAGTFHSLFLRLYSRYFKVYPQLLNEFESRNLLKEVLQSLQHNPSQEMLDRSIQEITQVKNRFAHPLEHMRKENSSHLLTLEAYELKKKSLGKWDYDDILLEFHAKLSDNGFLKFIRDQYAFVMVDEFQDTSRIQWLTLWKLCGHTLPLSVVGDDDQSIYRFRGAEPGVIHSYLKAYPQADEVILARNFRSADPIIEVSAKLIAHNTDRRKKEFVGMVGDGALPAFHIFLDAFAEAVQVAKTVKMSMGKADNQIAILARTNKQLYVVVEALQREKVFFSVQDPSILPYSQFDVQSLLKWLKASTDIASVKDLQQVFSQYLIGRGKVSTYYERMQRDRSLNVEEWKKKFLRNSQDDVLYDFFKMLDRINALSAKQAFQEAWKAYQLYFKVTSRKSLEDNRQFTVQNVGSGIPDTLSITKWLEDVQRKIKQYSSQTANVQVLTIHGAKGLEFDEVLIIGLNNEAMPHRKSMLDANDTNKAQAIAEERRLLYVGCTRAKSNLILSYAKKVGNTVCDPSPFLEEIGFSSKQDDSIRNSKKLKGSEESSMEYKYQCPKPGDVCVHKIFGQGKVQAISSFLDGGNKVDIQFEQGGIRTFYWEMAVKYGHFAKQNE